MEKKSYLVECRLELEEYPYKLPAASWMWNWLAGPGGWTEHTQQLTKGLTIMKSSGKSTLGRGKQISMQRNSCIIYSHAIRLSFLVSQQLQHKHFSLHEYYAFGTASWDRSGRCLAQVVIISAQTHADIFSACFVLQN